MGGGPSGDSAKWGIDSSRQVHGWALEIQMSSMGLNLD